MRQGAKNCHHMKKKRLGSNFRGKDPFKKELYYQPFILENTFTKYDDHVAHTVARLITSMKLWMKLNKFQPFDQISMMPI